MSKVWRFVSNLGFDGFTLVLTGVAAIVIGILEFTPIVTLSPGIMLQIIVVAVGLVMGSVASQGSQSSQQLKKLRNELRLLTGGTDVKLLESQHQSPQHLVQSILQAKRFVCDSNLMEVAPRQLTDPQAEYRRILNKRLREGNLIFQRVDVIYGEHNLRKVVRRLLEHQGENYFLRCYVGDAKQPIPVLSMMSFDDAEFYLGGFYPGVPPGQETGLYIRSEAGAPFLAAYWHELWNSATPLNPSGVIDWPRLREIAKGIGINEDTLSDIVAQLKAEIGA